MTARGQVLISIIVSTYNWPEALGPVLDSLMLQSDQNIMVKDRMKIRADFGPCWKTAKGQNPLSAMPKVIYFSIDTLTGRNSMRIKNYRETLSHANTR